MAGGANFCRHVCHSDFHHDLRQQEIIRRNLRVRHTPFALADLNIILNEVEESRNETQK